MRGEIHHLQPVTDSSGQTRIQLEVEGLPDIEHRLNYEVLAEYIRSNTDDCEVLRQPIVDELRCSRSSK